MILSFESQALLFLFTVGVGFVIGIIYDVFRIIRKIIKHKNFFTQVEDFIFWVVVTFIMFYLMLNNNYGEIRFFSVGGALLGMLLYFLTLSRIVIPASLTIANFVGKVIITALNIILFPIKVILKILRVPWLFILGIFNKVFKNCKKHLKKSMGYVKIKRNKLINEVKIIVKKS